MILKLGNYFAKLVLPISLGVCLVCCVTPDTFIRLYEMQTNNFHLSAKHKAGSIESTC